MKLTLMNDWKKTFKKYSFIFTAMAVITGLAGFILPYLGFLQPVVSEAVYGSLMFTFSVLAGASKFFKQYKLDDSVQDIPSEEIEDVSPS